MTAIALSRLHFPVTVLGPGQRVGIWFQGCSIRCPGCISADTWPEVEPDMTVTGVLDFLADWLARAEGITISGGEPFDQPEALQALLFGLRERIRPDTDIFVYSGYPIERLEPIIRDWAGLIDVLMTDPFDLDSGDRLALRGSDNQRLTLLTELGRERATAYDRPRQPSDDRFDLMADADGPIWLAGIPRRGDLERLRTLLAGQGTVIVTSEHPVRQHGPFVQPETVS